MICCIILAQTGDNVDQDSETKESEKQQTHKFQDAPPPETLLCVRGFLSQGENHTKPPGKMKVSPLKTRPTVQCGQSR